MEPEPGGRHNFCRGASFATAARGFSYCPPPPIRGQGPRRQRQPGASPGRASPCCPARGASGANARG
eukprot:4994048-Pyramimonas_sp.AAC.1